ncbi:hypothetical protein LIT38_15765 [Bacillus sp. CMF12]|uniref:hypothetical protein n=1 Tax=Bacillus sp. CMF12 TaxID=2884834 RepID=UPI002079E4CB|nr:hypothetical protein [Bacillus sp. CMF12]USK48029.1 hypothetical protein LIT38_15765 [Bacillus sp. CMF12]
MFNFNNRLTESDKRYITESISDCYNNTVSNSTPSFVKIEKFNLFFTFSVHEGNFQTSVLKLSDCRFILDSPVELPTVPIYAGLFDFNKGYEHFVNGDFITNQNEEAVRYIHDEVCRIFVQLAEYLVEQIENIE